jgi:hypothetical protein
MAPIIGDAVRDCHTDDGISQVLSGQYRFLSQAAEECLIASHAVLADILERLRGTS